MASPWLVEGKHAGDFIVSEASSGASGVSRSRSVKQYNVAEASEAGQVVAIVAGKVVPFEVATHTTAGVLNADTLIGVLFDNQPAGDGTTDVDVVVLMRDCEVNAAEIVIKDTAPADITTVIEVLENSGILVHASATI